MGIVVSVYSKKAFKEFILPSIDNSDHEIVFEREAFALQHDLRLKLEIMDGNWRIRPDLHYAVEWQDKTPYMGERLKDSDILFINGADHEKISLIVREIPKIFHAYEKFQIKDSGNIMIGKSKEADIIYNYKNMVSACHAMIQEKEHQFWIVNHSQNGTYINSVRVDTETKLKFGDYINIMGLHMVFLGNTLAIDMEGYEISLNTDKIRPYEEVQDMTLYLEGRERKRGRQVYHRAPRHIENLLEGIIELEELPEQKAAQTESMVWLQIPVLLLLAAVLYKGVFLSIGMGAMICAMAYFVYSKWKKEWQEKRALQNYKAYLQETQDEIRKKYQESHVILEKRYPSAKFSMAHYVGEGMLWNRNWTHQDFLTHRLGTGNRTCPFSICMKEKQNHPYDRSGQLVKEMQKSYGQMQDVPITIDFMEHTLIGVIGGEGKSGALEIARIIGAQIAANNCYTDVKMGFFYNGEVEREKKAFAFAKWLPHTWSEDKKVRFLASDQKEANEIFYDWMEVFRSRGMEEKEKRPHYVLICTECAMIEQALIAKYVFDPSKRYGFTTILLAESYEELPNDCTFMIQNDADHKGIYEVGGSGEERIPIVFDEIKEEELQEFARDLAGIEVQEIEEGQKLPERLTFFDMMGITSPQELRIKELWAKNRVYENIRGMIGQKAGGQTCFLDIHEKYHGPHGLIAGATGSGKSEMLHTWILSLAVQYSPEDLGFFIIDFKGGGLGKLFDDLPHTMGQISNLSGNQIKRAMISLKSESRRRQRIFGKYEIANINEYTRLYKNGEVKEALPHLLIIIDEFAELKREEPEFMKELISIAQIGRSQGMHLLLSTQRPGGTVDDNIWSNAKFRICLRVENKKDSIEMLHKADAAFLTHIGQGYLQVGNDEVYEHFLSAYSRAIYHEETKEQVDIARMLQLNGKVEFTGKTLRKDYKKQEKKKECSQLEAVKEYLKKVAQENGYTKRKQLYLLVLGKEIYLEECQGKEDTGGICAILGMADDPEDQMQMPIEIDFLRDGHVAVCGSPMSGKSTAVQTLMYALIDRYTPQQIHLYGIDFNGKMMSAFEDAPQVGEILYEEEKDKMAKFFQMMAQIVKERKTKLKGVNYRQYLNKHGFGMPAIIIFIDQYASWKERTEGMYEEAVVRLAKEGMSLGIYLVVTGMGISVKDIPQRLGENIRKVLCMGLMDRYAYGTLLHQFDFAILPEEGIKGRGMTMVERRPLEYQTALVKKTENDYERLEYIKRYCKEKADAWQGTCARCVPQIPDQPQWQQFVHLEEAAQMIKEGRYLPIGYRTEDASIYGIDLKDTYCYLVCGAAESGKTNFMKAALAGADRMGAKLSVIASHEAKLARYAQKEGIHVVSAEEELFGYLKELIPEFKRRNEWRNRRREEGYGDEEIFTEMSQEIPYVICIPDFCWFIDLIYQARRNIRGFVENLFEKGWLQHIYFIAGITLDGIEEVRGYPAYESFVFEKRGICLGGKVMENPVFAFDDLSFLEQRRRERIGIGWIPPRNEQEKTKKIVVPLMKGGKDDDIDVDA